jgi:hypothetical protein
VPRRLVNTNGVHPSPKLKTKEGDTTGKTIEYRHIEFTGAGNSLQSTASITRFRWYRANNEEPHTQMVAGLSEEYCFPHSGQSRWDKVEINSEPHSFFAFNLT